MTLQRLFDGGDTSCQECITMTPMAYLTVFIGQDFLFLFLPACLCLFRVAFELFGVGRRALYHIKC